ncbi:DNA-binding protein [Haemophilus influenzae]|uniref:helix-turn-helix domain-containing protein n=1 Tax=Haemophilus influenzae TaxID=727 RepID=UPI00093B38A6|nr:helix-turn-helix domain-containing protein [Haemophilus influenzae]OKQ01419.1 DNA-binding protein [Haemophilus influenzae]
MSMRLMVQAMNCKVGNPARKLVLLKLADNANDDGICFPSYQYIADKCEMTRRSAISHIEYLIKMGLVSKKERKNKDGSISNLYFLHLEQGSENFALGGSEKFAPITSHSLEPVNEPKKTTQKSESEMLLERFGITGQLAKDFITHRKAKKAPITETAMNGFLREANKVRLSVAESVAISIERNWQGFKATWYLKDKELQSIKQPQSSNTFADDGSWAIGRQLNIDPDLIPEELR